MRSQGNDINLGIVAERNRPLFFPRTQRNKHLYVCGITGMGKSKFLEYLIRQDIVAWRKSKCAVIVLDPHGNLYDGLIAWLAWNNIDRPIIPIDLRQDEWVVSYNLLRRRPSVDPAVLVDNIVDAMAYVWGQTGTNQTPLFARWASNVIRALYEKNLTLVEAEHLIDRVAKQVRYALTADLSDRPSRQDWAFADTLSAKDFEAQIGSTGNRFQRFIRNETMRAIFGQANVSLDLGRVLDEGSIVLVNLSKERAKVSKENSELFATLVLNDLWTAAQERGKRDNLKPAYLYADEFQRFISPTIAENLDEARGYGLHLTLAHQYPEQLKNRGDSGKQVFDSVMENAASKVVFRLSHEENLRVMAQWLFRGVMDPDQIKHELYSTKVMEYREELRTHRSRGKGRSTGEGAFIGNTTGDSTAGRIEENQREDPDAWNTYGADSTGTSEMWIDSESESETESSMLVPEMGKELSSVQFRSLDEQLFRAMAVLFDQEERFGVARLAGMNAPVSIHTPTIYSMPNAKERIAKYLARHYKKLDFALKGSVALKEVNERLEGFAKTLIAESTNEPVTTRRKVRQGKPA